MFVCLCHGISDKKIKALVRSGVTSLQEIQASCKAGANCGSCVCQLKEIISESCQQISTEENWPKAGGDK